MKTRVIGPTFFTGTCRARLGAPASVADFPNPDETYLPPSTLIASPPQRDIPRWLQTNLRVGQWSRSNHRGEP